jgi:RNA polymerase sigma-70 factor (ECF subfamily)
MSRSGRFVALSVQASFPTGGRRNPLRDDASPLAEVIALPARRAWTPEAIVSGLRARSSEAGAMLHARLGGRVNRLVWRLLGADAEHDDVVHQVFVNALARLDTLRDPAALDHWIVGVAVNTVRRELRNRGFRRRLHLLGEPPDEASPGPGPHETAVARRLYAVVSALDADLRIAFCLRVLDELTLPEVAEACGCSLATAKRRLAAATREIERRAEGDALLADYLTGGGHGA